jgi:uncharacterized protein (DUF1330 family)
MTARVIDTRPRRPDPGTMSSYAIAHLRSVDVGPPIVEYLNRIDATLEPYGGRFIIHGGPVEVLENSWPGSIVVIEFPTSEAAHAWYRSPAYQAILPLRTENSDGSAIIVDGVTYPHHSADVLKASATATESAD